GPPLVERAPRVTLHAVRPPPPAPTTRSRSAWFTIGWSHETVQSRTLTRQRWPSGHFCVPEQGSWTHAPPLPSGLQQARPAMHLKLKHGFITHRPVFGSQMSPSLHDLPLQIGVTHCPSTHTFPGSQTTRVQVPLHVPVSRSQN